MKTNRLHIICLIALAACMARGQSLEETFLKGNIAYGNQEYAEAESAYRSVLDQVQSAEVHYNLGNTLAQQGEWAEAAFHYLHAQALDPNMEAARANLLLATKRLGLSSQYPRLSRPASFLSEREWATLGAITFWISLILFFHGDFIRYRLPLSKTLGSLALVVTLISVVGILQHKLFRDWGVVSSSLATLRVAPTEQSPGESVLIEGDPVRIVDSQQGFFLVMTASGDEGFVLNNEVFHLPRD